MGSEAWWRIPGFPYPEEWQALAGILTLLLAVVGVAITIRQVRLSREANERSAEAAEAAARPYLSVYLELRAVAPSDPQKSSGEGMTYITIESTGSTPARNITLNASPAFESSGRGTPPGDDDPVITTLRKIFSGEFTIGMMAPHQTLSYFLDMASEAFDPNARRPLSYTVKAIYENAELTRRYAETVVIDMEPWGMSIMEVQPLDVIARQFRRLNEKGLPHGNVSERGD